MVREKTYHVVSKNPVMVDFPDGNSVSYHSGSWFKADPLNPYVGRLLRINAIREVTPREIPNINVGGTPQANS